MSPAAKWDQGRLLLFRKLKKEHWSRKAGLRKKKSPLTPKSCGRQSQQQPHYWDSSSTSSWGRRVNEVLWTQNKCPHYHHYGYYLGIPRNVHLGDTWHHLNRHFPGFSFLNFFLKFMFCFNIWKHLTLTLNFSIFLYVGMCPRIPTESVFCIGHWPGRIGWALLFCCWYYEKNAYIIWFNTKCHKYVRTMSLYVILYYLICYHIKYIFPKHHNLLLFSSSPS
jgi:hypothetical protein